jgi:hypothetical protein
MEEGMGGARWENRIEISEIIIGKYKVKVSSSDHGGSLYQIGISVQTPCGVTPLETTDIETKDKLR